jgi:hypothetical protein
MRSLLLALVALAVGASPASAAVIEFRVDTCSECDSGYGNSEDTVTIVVRALPGELNRISVRRSAGGILITDAGAPLSGRCRPVAGGGRVCRSDAVSADVSLGDLDDTLDTELSGSLDPGPGDDQVRGTGEFYALSGSPGTDLLDASAAQGATVSYAGHADGVTVRLNGLPDDGAAGEHDNVLGQVTVMIGGSGHDRLEAGPTSSGLFGGGGDDTLVGSPERDTIEGDKGDDELFGGGGTDFLSGGEGADVLGGGDGFDEVSYGGRAPLWLSIGDGANDGAAGESDDIREDIEALTGGSGDDVLIGDDDSNRLLAYGGHDILRGAGGADRLIGRGDGDELYPGPGSDKVEAGWLDRPRLADGEVDELDCDWSAPLLEADAFDQLETCAARVFARRLTRPRSGQRMTLTLRCSPFSPMPCRGRLWIHSKRGSRVSSRARFGPVTPGTRLRVTLRLRPRLRRGICLYATTVNRRTDGFESSSSTRTPIGCVSG